MLKVLSTKLRAVRALLPMLCMALLALPLMAQEGGEASLKLPNLDSATFLNGIGGRTLLMFGLIFCVLGMVFGLTIYMRLKNMAVHRSMLEVSELIYETCKTYLITQGKFLILLECFIGVIIVFYFGFLQGRPAVQVLIILLFSMIGIAGSYSVAAFGMRVNTFANSRAAFASLRGKAFPCYDIPLQAGMSIGMLLISVELIMMLFILLFIPGDLAGPCFIGFAIGESLGAAALRVAGGIFTKIADIGADLMKIVFKIKEDDVRNPGVIADCTGDNAGDSVGPSADGFETYGVTGVALITFILLAVKDPDVAGAVAGVDFRHARDDDHLLGGQLLHQRHGGQSQVRQRGEDELRSPADVVGVDDFAGLSRIDLPGQLLHHSELKRRYQLVVEAFDGDHLRHVGRRGYPRGREGLHLHLIETRA